MTAVLNHSKSYLAAQSSVLHRWTQRLQEEYLMFYISMLLLTFKNNFKMVRLVAKCKLIFIEWFARLRLNTPKFILVFSIHPEISVSNTI